MAGLSDTFQTHLQSGVTTVCRCWAIFRRDGEVFGFTDHDQNLGFEGISFRADTGLSALALQQSTGLAVDNSEALGVLSDAAVEDADIDAGRFDDAEIRAWLVNWADVEMRWLQFRGKIGELTRTAGAFRAELRGLTDALNRPFGRVFQKPCSAVLGDLDCRFDMNTPAFSHALPIEVAEGNQVFIWSAFDPFETDWFARGRLEITEGEAKGLWGIVKRDLVVEGQRRIELWEPLRMTVKPGDQVRLTAGCDRTFETCRLKFANQINFQGFPDIPGEDWMMTVPRRTDLNTGGSRR